MFYNDKLAAQSFPSLSCFVNSTRNLPHFVGLLLVFLLSACDKAPDNQKDTLDTPQNTPPVIDNMQNDRVEEKDNDNLSFDNLPDTPDTTPPKPPTFYERLSDAALDRTLQKVRYDPKYVSIPYPMGDVPANTGVCTDVVIRSYRELGIDLQEHVHEDMRDNFSSYPSKKVWGLKKADSNIDHRRVYNLQVFFERFGESLPITNDPRDYQVGDLVTWQITPKFPHIGIVVDVATHDPDRKMIVHNIGEGPKIDDILFAFPISGHYRFNKTHAQQQTQTHIDQML
ncbi:MAG: DUF1287 domain-containing protein [bacterium]